MGSSLSPVLANIYMEHFESYLLEDIPVDMRPTLWLRFVDDIFICYEDMDKFEEFLQRLNNIRPSISFTFELSSMSDTTSDISEFPRGATECLPFLELRVYRLNDGNFAFSIYRKPCHAGNYLHAYSYMPLFMKTTVIRSLFLRAYRYCDKQLLPQEELRIKQDFLVLGYSEKFIEKGRISAIKGRHNEIKRQEGSAASTVKQKPIATLTLPYHPTMMKLRPRLGEMGIRLAFSSNSTLRQQLHRLTSVCKPPRGSVYVINCSGCTDVYIGQTGRAVGDRMSEHDRDPVTVSGAVHTHNILQGHHMDACNPIQVFRSDCTTTRCTVEAALIHLAPTIPHNTASASVDSNDLVAALITRATKLNWERLAHCIPHLKEDAVPSYKRKIFGGNIIRPPRPLATDTPGTPIARATRAARIRRSQEQPTMSSQGPLG